MGEHIFRVSLEDLKTVRVTCAHCGVIVEVPLDKLASTFNGGKCLSCGTSITPGQNGGRLRDLAGAIGLLAANGSEAKVEFPIKLADGGEKATQ